MALAIGCVVTPPPRFALHTDEDGFARFARVGLAVNDGVQFLVVERGAHSAQRQLDEVFDGHEVARGEVLKHGNVSYADGADQLRVAVLHVRGFIATMVTTPSQPLDAIVSELDALARSLR